MSKRGKSAVTGRLVRSKATGSYHVRSAEGGRFVIKGSRSGQSGQVREAIKGTHRKSKDR